MDMDEARAILERVLAAAEAEGYETLAAKAAAGEGSYAEVDGALGAAYQVETAYLWDAGPASAVLVIVSVDDGGLRAFAPLARSILVRSQA